MDRDLLRCDSCNKKYKTSDKLAAHQNTHRVQSQNIFSCTLCTRKYKSADTLAIHMDTHAASLGPVASSVGPVASVGPVLYSCPSCNKKYKTEDRLTKHLLTHLPSRNEPNVHSTVEGAISAYHAVLRLEREREREQSEEREKLMKMERERERLISLERIKALDELNEPCIICYQDIIDHIVTPCGHMCCCLSCSVSVKKSGKCPICRSSIQSIIKVYKV